jgi:hypothetical protein
MSKIDEIYDEGLINIGHILDDYYNSGTLSNETAFEEIENIIKQTKIKAGNEYIKMCKMYQLADKITEDNKHDELIVDRQGKEL